MESLFRQDVPDLPRKVVPICPCQCEKPGLPSTGRGDLPRAEAQGLPQPGQGTCSTGRPTDPLANRETPVPRPRAPDRSKPTPLTGLIAIRSIKFPGFPRCSKKRLGSSNELFHLFTDVPLFINSRHQALSVPPDPTLHLSFRHLLVYRRMRTPGRRQRKTSAPG